MTWVPAERFRALSFSRLGMAGVLFFILMTGCAPTGVDLENAISEAGTCSEGQTCTLAGGTDCSCPAPVRADREHEINEIASRVACDGVRVRCVPTANPRCESDRCVADGL
jgi:hypothetical protein